MQPYRGHNFTQVVPDIFTALLITRYFVLNLFKNVIITIIFIFTKLKVPIDQ